MKVKVRDNDTQTVISFALSVGSFWNTLIVVFFRIFSPHAIVISEIASQKKKYL